MSRATQEKLSGLPGRTQRYYCQVAEVKRQQNIAIGGKYTQEAAQECAWRRGRAMFKFNDVKGKQGRPGGHYLAWHLPTTHIGPHQPTSQGRQRKVNRKLQDLVIHRARGNSSEKVSQLYWPDGSTAAKVYNRTPYVDAYWRAGSLSSKHQVWRVLLVG